MRRALLPVLALSLSTCTRPTRTDAYAARDEFFKAVCRMFSRDGCAGTQLDTCLDQKGTAQFSSNDECQAYFRFRYSGCFGLAQSLNADRALVDACVAEIDSFQCGVDPFCTDNEWTFLLGDSCVQVNMLFQSACSAVSAHHDTGDSAAPSDSADTGAP